LQHTLQYNTIQKHHASLVWLKRTSNTTRHVAWNVRACWQPVKSDGTDACIYQIHWWQWCQWRHSFKVSYVRAMCAAYMCMCCYNCLWVAMLLAGADVSEELCRISFCL